jgi:hypothetical protein
MHLVTNLSRLLLCGCSGLLLLSCSVTIPILEQESWKQFSAEVDAQPERQGPVNLQFAWEIPNKRLLILARINEAEVMLYQIDHKAGLKPGDDAKRVTCYFQRNQLYCASPADVAPMLVAGPGADVWAMLEAHAIEQIDKINAFSQQTLQAQLHTQQMPQVDLIRQRHPFEWGGEYETVENAQAFLDAVTAQGTLFRSSWPRAPWLGSQGNEWQNQGDVVTLKTAERCVTLASSASRTAFHYNHDFWAADTVKFLTNYRWQQPIDWRSIKGIRAEDDGVFFHGNYAGTFPEQGLTYLSGWSPDVITVNASTFDPEDYSVADWNVHLLLPDVAGLRERVLYAVTYLDIMCSKG